jgi:hypothetical protein
MVYIKSYWPNPILVLVGPSQFVLSQKLNSAFINFTIKGPSFKPVYASNKVKISLGSETFIRNFFYMVKVKGKGKVSPVLKQVPCHEDVWENGGMTPRIRSLSVRWKCVVSFTARLLYPRGNFPRYPLNRRLGEPEGQSGHGGEEKNSLILSGT